MMSVTLLTLHSPVSLSQDHLYYLPYVALADLYPPLLGHPAALPQTLVVTQFPSVYPHTRSIQQGIPWGNVTLCFGVS